MRLDIAKRGSRGGDVGVKQHAIRRNAGAIFAVLANDFNRIVGDQPIQAVIERGDQPIDVGGRKTEQPELVGAEMALHIAEFAIVAEAFEPIVDRSADAALRTAPRFPMTNEMQQRLPPGRANIVIERAVPGDVEMRTRRVALLPADVKIVRQRIKL